ncbi:MAG: DUF1648 domain-containing protein [Lachnospiraceae bacterium]|nr:DUF1648 domain-containing protein [Lachnospiraceae bacterium]
MRKSITVCLTILPLIVTILLMPYMIDSVPMHYNFAGEVDRYGSKYEELIFPLLIIILSMLFSLYKNKNRDDRNSGLMDYLQWVILVIFNITQYYFLFKDFATANFQVDIRLLSGIMGAAIIIAGILTRYSKRNDIIGLRTKWSKYSDLTWEKSNHFASVLFVLAGLLIIIMSVANVSNYIFIIDVCIVCVVSVLSVIGSYHFYKQEKVEQGN